MEKILSKNGSEIVYLRGKLFWAKILGDPLLNYSGDAKEWTMDLSVDADGEKQLKSLGIAYKLKNKDDERGKFLSFKQRELKKDGTPAKPIRVTAADGQTPWDQSKKIGNETVADVKFELRDYGKDKSPNTRFGIYPRAVRILDHVEYGGSEFPQLSKDDEFFQKAQEAEKTYKMSPEEDAHFKETFLGHTRDDDLEDDVTFA
jgi:hypothetical protein